MPNRLFLLAFLPLMLCLCPHEKIPVSTCVDPLAQTNTPFMKRTIALECLAVEGRTAFHQEQVRNCGKNSYLFKIGSY